MKRTTRDARRIWREALRASLAVQRERASDWLLSAWERETRAASIDSASLSGCATPTATRAPRGEMASPADQKRRWRSDPANREREREWYEARQRAKGVRPRAEFLAEKKARALIDAPAKRERAKQKQAERRADEAFRKAQNERTRARREAMTLEERRAEWLRHQHARRERLRLAREMSEAAE